MLVNIQYLSPLVTSSHVCSLSGIVFLSEKLIMTTKRSRRVLPIKDKITIINRLEEGESVTSLSKVYNVGKATISDIKGRKIEILKFASKLGCLDGIAKRKIMKKPNDVILDEAVYLWYKQMRSLGQLVSGHLLRTKALELNEIFGGSTDFKASTGWLANFKIRHGIKLKLTDNLNDDEMVWLKDDSVSQRNAVLSDEDNVMSVLEERSVNLKQDDCSTEILRYNPSHAEAFIALETAMAWCEHQSECNSKELFILKKMKNLAAQKIHSALIDRKEVCMVLSLNKKDKYTVYPGPKK